MSTSLPPPPPGAPTGRRWPTRWWARFRGWPLAAQIIVGLLMWPAVLALLIASDRDATPWRYGVAATVLIVGGALWLPSDAPPDRPAVEVAAVGQTEAADAQASQRAQARRVAADERREAAEAEVAREERAAARAAAAEERRVRRAEERAAAEEAAAKEAAAAEAAAVEAAAARGAEAGWTVTNVVDGDTVDVEAPDGRSERVRIVGIDTPERGECGFGEASAAMATLVLHQRVELVAGARDDRDRWDRVLRYVDVDGTDAGLTLIERGLAIARYDSRDGYGRHEREDRYVAADAATPHTCTGAPPPTAPAPAQPSGPPATSGPGSGPNGAWKNCTEAREAGAAPVHRGTPGYGPHLDRDADGIGCE